MIIIIMKASFEHQFMAQQKQQFRSLKSMVQNKHQIRINFSKSKAYQLLQLDLAQQHNQVPSRQLQVYSPPLQMQNEQQLAENEWAKIKNKCSHLERQRHELYQAIQNRKHRFKAQQVFNQDSRGQSSAISRSYRRKKVRSSLSSNTIDQPCLDILLEKGNKNTIKLQNWSYNNQSTIQLSQNVQQSQPIQHHRRHFSQHFKGIGTNKVISHKYIEFPQQTQLLFQSKKQKKLHSNWTYHLRKYPSNPQEIPILANSSDTMSANSQANPFLVNMKPATGVLRRRKIVSQVISVKRKTYKPNLVKTISVSLPKTPVPVVQDTCLPWQQKQAAWEEQQKQPVWEEDKQNQQEIDSF